MGAAALFGGAAALGAIGSYSGARAQRKSLEYQQAVANQNAQLAEQQAKDAIVRGQESKSKFQREFKGFRGAQVNAMSGSGLLIGSESFGDILDSSDMLAEIDAMNIMRNAEREAYGLQVEAQNQRSNAGFLKANAKATSPLFSAGTSLLTSGMQYYGATR